MILAAAPTPLLASPDVPPELIGLGTVGIVLMVAVMLLGVILWLASVFSIIGSTYSLGMKLLLIIACFSFPVLGPLGWFLIVRGNQPGGFPMRYR